MCVEKVFCGTARFLNLYNTLYLGPLPSSAPWIDTDAFSGDVEDKFFIILAANNNDLIFNVTIHVTFILGLTLSKITLRLRFTLQIYISHISRLTTFTTFHIFKWATISTVGGWTTTITFSKTHLAERGLRIICHPALFHVKFLLKFLFVSDLTLFVLRFYDSQL